MDNNKNQRLVNYLSAILLILIVVIVSYTIYTQRISQESKVSSLMTTSTVQTLPSVPIDQTDFPEADSSAIEEISYSFEELFNQEDTSQESDYLSLPRPLAPPPPLLIDEQ